MESPDNPRTSAGPYARHARAREGVNSPTFDSLFTSGVSEASPLELRQCGRLLKKAYNRERWRRLNQTRCSILASALHAVEIAMGPRYAGRERMPDKKWVIFGTDDGGARVPAVDIANNPMHRFDDYREPVTLHIKRTWLVDVEKLHAWIRWTRETWGQALARNRLPGWR